MLRSTLKKNIHLQRAVNRLRNLRAFLQDAWAYNRHNMEAAQRQGDYRYRIMLLVHSLEKGMCMPNPRPYGQQKAADLLTLLRAAQSQSTHRFEYDLGLSVLHAWLSFHEQQGYEDSEIQRAARQYLSEAEPPKLKAGFRQLPLTATGAGSARYSVRDFDDKPLREEDLRPALEAFIATPTACNRQMCRLIHVQSPALRQLLHTKIPGIHGFNLDTVNYFAISYDLAAFSNYYERDQGLLNAGLAAMSFVSALHSRSIGSCFLQWGTTPSDDLLVRRALGLRESERLAVMLGVGYYKPGSLVPASCRKALPDVYMQV